MQDVTLPNGRIVFDVPEDVSNEELKEISIRSGWATAEDFDPQPVPMSAPVVEEVEEETSIIGQTGEFLKAVPRGFASGFLSSAEGIAELADATTNFVGLEDLIDSGEENELVRLAREGRKSLNESFLGVDEKYKDAWTTKLGEGVGSLATFLTPGVIARVAGTAGKTMKAIEYGGAGALAVGAGAGDQAQRIQAARDAGLNVDNMTEDQAIVSGAAVGLSELVLPINLFKRFDRIASDDIKKEALNRIKSALASGSTEAVQEATAGIAQDLIEKGLYNENLPLYGSLMDDLTVGGATGALADLVLTSAAGRRRQTSVDSEKAKDEGNIQQEEQDQETVRQTIREEAEIQQELAQAVDETYTDFAGQLQAQDLAAKEAEIRERRRAEASPDGIRPRRGEDYASIIESSMGAYFPSSAKFDVRESISVDPTTGQERTQFEVFETSTNQRFGVPVNKTEAVKLLDGLNKKVISKNVMQQATDAMDISPETYDTEQASKLYRIHKRVLEPEVNTVTSASLNEAAGTTFLLEDKDGKIVSFPETATFEEIIERTGRKSINRSDLPASMQLNLDRYRDGLPESDSFTFEEAAKVLNPDQMQDLISIQVKARTESESYQSTRNEKGEPAVISTDGKTTSLRPRNERERAQAEREGINPDSLVKFTSQRDATNFANKQNQAIGTGPVPRGIADLEGGGAATEIQNLLNNKNIDAKVNSREVKAIAKSFVGKSDIGKMTTPERELFYYKLRAFPKFDKPTKLPKNFFRVKPFTRQQFNAAKNAINDTGESGVNIIRQASGLLDQDSLTNKKVLSLREELVEQGVINKRGKVLAPSPKRPEPPTVMAQPKESTLDEETQRLISKQPKAPVLDETFGFPVEVRANQIQSKAEQEASVKTGQARRSVDQVKQSLPPSEVGNATVEEVIEAETVDRAERNLPPDEFASFEAPTTTRGDRFIFQFADKLIGLKKIEEAINAGREKLGLSPIPALKSAYLGEESIAGKVGESARVFQREEVDPIVEDLVAINTEKSTQEARKEFDDYLTLRHAIERNKRISEVDPQNFADGGAGSILVGDQEVRLTDDYVKTRMKEEFDLDWNDSKGEWTGGNKRAKELEKIAKKTDAIIQGTLDLQLESGLHSQEDHDMLSGLFKYYVPLKGKAVEDDFAELYSATAGTSGNLGTKGAEGKRALGRKSAAESPLATLIADRNRQIARAAKNVNIGQRLYDLAKENPNTDVWEVIDAKSPRFDRIVESSYTYIPTGQKVANIPEGISKEERKNYVRRTKLTTKSAKEVGRENPDLFGVKINGEQAFIEIKDPDLKKALLNLDADNTNKIIQTLGTVNRFFSAVNTSFNPEFVVGNFARDIQTAVYNILGEQSMPAGKAEDTKIVKQVVKDTFPSIKAFYKGFRNSGNQTEQERQDYKEYISAGAKADWFHSRPPGEQLKTIETMIEMSKGTFKGGFRKGYESVKDYVEDANAAVENGVRFASFKAARDQFIEKGIPRDEAIAKAATLAKNLTVNFNRSGDLGPTLNSLYLFFNASVQGTLNFARGLNVFDPKSSRLKQKIVGSMIGGGALAAALAEAMSDEDENGKSFYMNIPEFEKERNIIIMRPNGKDYFKIPLPYGYNAFHVMGQNIFESLAGLKSPEKAATMVTKTLMGSFNPIGFASSQDFSTQLLKTGSPTALDPFVEIAVNENFFGSPVYTENFPFGTQLPESQLSKSSTNEYFKNLAKFLNGLGGGNESEPGLGGVMDISPDKLQHLFNFSLGGMGATALRTKTAFDKIANDENISVNQIPFVRRVLGEVDHRTSQQDFYERSADIKRKANQTRNVLRGAERSAYIKENQPYLSMESVMKATDKRIRAINERLTQLRSLSAQSPDNAKRYMDEEERLLQLKKQAYDRFNKRFNYIVGEDK